MNLGAFSVSLSVQDIETSREFYKNLGFTQFGGDVTQNWLILKNGDHVIGLFQGMFEKNMLTFNPGWDNNAHELESFTDIRELQRQLKAVGMEFASDIGDSSSGPGSFVVIDPDGNTDSCRPAPMSRWDRSRFLNKVRFLTGSAVRR